MRLFASLRVTGKEYRPLAPFEESEEFPHSWGFRIMTENQKLVKHIS
jgi:hypothetical protein